MSATLDRHLHDSQERDTETSSPQISLKEATSTKAAETGNLRIYRPRPSVVQSSSGQLTSTSESSSNNSSDGSVCINAMLAGMQARMIAVITSDMFLSLRFCQCWLNGHIVSQISVLKVRLYDFDQK